MSLNQTISIPKGSGHRLTKVAVGFLLLLAATLVAAGGSHSNVATLTANQIAEQF